MNSLSIANPTLLVAGITGFTVAYELLKTDNYIGGAIAGLLGVIAVVLYDRLPATRV